MGVSSIIAILVILVLVVFSALSITTSKADYNLSKKTSDGVIAFYEADSAAEDKMAEVAAAIDSDSGSGSGGGWQNALKAEGYRISAADDGERISYVVEIDENRNLEVELLAAEDGKLTRERWQVVPSKEWVADDSVTLFK